MLNSGASGDSAGPRLAVCYNIYFGAPLLAGFTAAGGGWRWKRACQISFTALTTLSAIAYNSLGEEAAMRSKLPRADGVSGIGKARRARTNVAAYAAARARQPITKITGI